MKPGFCGECGYLSITEKEQDKLKPKPEHICNKFNVKLYHFIYHPKITRCNQCLLVPDRVYSSKVKNSFGEPGVIVERAVYEQKYVGSLVNGDIFTEMWYKEFPRRGLKK